MISPSDLRARLPGAVMVCAMAIAIGFPKPGQAEPPGAAPSGSAVGRGDWHLDPAPFKARAERSADGGTLTLDNGLVRRTIRIADGCATVALDDLAGGARSARIAGPRQPHADGVAAGRVEAGGSGNVDVAGAVAGQGPRGPDEAVAAGGPAEDARHVAVAALGPAWGPAWNPARPGGLFGVGPLAGHGMRPRKNLRPCDC